MKNKIKYESKFDPFDIEDSIFFDISELDCLKQLDVADNPTIYKSVPNGTYYIRGNTKGEAKVYAVYDNIWYLSKLNNYGLETNSRFITYPNLKQSEWEELKKHFPKLNQEWQSYVAAWSDDESFRNSKREFKKLFFKKA